ncbi:MAG: TVP38/TMEM64 family protein [Roseiarcus sp.]|jgi:uncharacterized membrane protein YdjX (TVP38/TMEM64 family)
MTGAAVHVLSVSDPEQAIHGLRDYLLSFGLWAPVVSAALMIGLQVVFAPIPTFFVTFANGLLFGWAWGAALSWASAMAGATACFWIARALGRPVAQSLVGGSKAFEATDLFFLRYGDRAVLISRLLPFVSFRVVSYAAGLTPIAFWRFLLATGLGQLPATLLYSYLGGRLTRSAQMLFWALSISLALFIAGWAVGPRLAARLRKPVEPMLDGAETAPEAEPVGVIQ